MPDFLKKEALKNSVQASEESTSRNTEEGVLPEPPQPSLKMRLFAAGGKQRQLLCAMFGENKNDTEQRDQTSVEENINNSKKRKKDNITGTM